MGFWELQAMALLGLMGTGHCIGMCGPLVAAFPGSAGRFRAHLWYHAGRLATYGVLGVVAGAIGSGIGKVAAAAGGSELLWVARAQVGLSILAGGVLLLMGMARIGLLREPEWMAAASPARIPGFGAFARTVAGRPSDAGMLAVGALMGLLPCGLSYAAFARAMAAEGPLEGGLMVLCFGAGTLPGLLVLGTGVSALVRRYRRQSELLSGAIMVAMAVHLLFDAAAALG
jgi:sulfite exporter TauE/SafE